MKALIKIKSIQRHEGAEDTIELMTTGSFEKSETGWRIFYSETDEEKNVTDVEVTVEEDSVKILRKTGEVQSLLIVEKGNKHFCSYNTHFGALTVGIFGTKLESRITKLGGYIRLCYSIDINSAYSGENEIGIRIKSKEEA